MAPEPTYVLITGATSGIGRALCDLFTDPGYILIVSGRNPELLCEVKKSLENKVPVLTVQADLSVKEERKRIVDLIRRYAPEYVINNAGFGLYGDCLTYTTDRQADILEVNGKAVLELTLEAARTLVSKKKKGVICNVSSAAAFQVFPGLAVYAASKAFVNSFSQAFDQEMRPYGIRILASCPGPVSTAFGERAGGRKNGYKSYGVLTPEFVASEIRRQIQESDPLKIIDWKMRAAAYLSYLIPKNLLAPILRKNILRRLEPRTFIKIEQ